MRKFMVRGVMIAFVSAMGFFGSGGQVQFDGLNPSLETETASARMMQDPSKRCGDPGRLTPCDNNGPDPWGIGG